MKLYTNVETWGNNILVREVEDKIRRNYKVKFQPTIYIPSQHESEFHTLDGSPVQPVQHDTIKDCRDFIDNYKEMGDFPIYGNIQSEYQFISETYPGEIVFDKSLINITTLDIETGCENGFPKPELAEEEVLCITLKSNINDVYLVFENSQYGRFEQSQASERLKNLNVSVIRCENEHKLLIAFLNHWKRYCPDIVTGWYIGLFDIPYLVNRVKNVLGEEWLKYFSPWGIVKEKKFYAGGKEKIEYQILGVSILDYIDLYKKFTLHAQESYTLNHIAGIVLKEKKLSHEEFENMHTFYRSNWQKFVEYNIIDVHLVEKLEDKLKMIELCLYLAYNAKVNYADVLSQIRMWDSLIFNYLKERNIVIPPKKENSKSEQYVGAYVKDPQVGLHEWVVSFDLTSLYPNLQIQYCISPETLIGRDSRFPFEIGDEPDKYIDDLVNKRMDLSYLKSAGMTVSPAGINFDTSRKGVLPEILEKMFDERQRYKKIMLSKEKELELVKEELARRNVKKE